MADEIRKSRQTSALLSALLEAPSDWQYGYDLSRRTGLKSGTLYPILMRLSEREWLDTKWDFEAATGKPRHLYRLTGEGRRRARNMVDEPVLANRLPKPQLAR